LGETTPVATAPAKRGRPAKAAAPAAIEDEESEADEDEEFDLPSTDEEEDEEPAPAVEPEITTKDVLQALKTHPKQGAASKMIKEKFKVTSIKDLKPGQRAKVIAELAKLK
jgi:hypothetical protein